MDSSTRLGARVEDLAYSSRTCMQRLCLETFGPCFCTPGSMAYSLIWMSSIWQGVASAVRALISDSRMCISAVDHDHINKISSRMYSVTTAKNTKGLCLILQAWWRERGNGKVTIRHTSLLSLENPCCGWKSCDVTLCKVLGEACLPCSSCYLWHHFSSHYSLPPTLCTFPVRHPGWAKPFCCSRNLPNVFLFFSSWRWANSKLLAGLDPLPFNTQSKTPSLCNDYSSAWIRPHE